MNKLSPRVLKEIYFKSILPAVTYGIVVWGNCWSEIMDTLEPVHERAARFIHQQGHLQKSNCLPISYIYKRHLLLLLHDVFQDKVSNSIKSLFKEKMQRRSSRRGNQVEIPRLKCEVGKESVQYRGPVIWNFFNRIVNLNSSETTKEGPLSTDIT